MAGKMTHRGGGQIESLCHIARPVLPLLYEVEILFQMVYSYKRKTDRGRWSEADMERALEAVRSREMGWLRASRTFNVPTATLRRRALNKNKNAIGTKKCFGSIKSALNEEVETAIANHILDLESRFFGLTTIDVRTLAYEVAEKLKIKHSFNKERKMAGKGWLHGFRQRHPQLSLRLPEATSLARAEAFNRPQIDKFFAKLDQVINENEICDTMIYNMDESALTTVQVPPKVFAKKGKKQVGAITSAERGVHTTVVACMSSGGTYVPPAIIFPRKRFNPLLYDGAPLGTLKLHNESGYMTGDLFVTWMRHFINHVRPNSEMKALLILDGHASHKSYESLELAKQNSVVLLCLPAHCTHHLQPLDVAFFGPLHKYYNQAVTQWLKTNPGRTVSIYQVAKFLNQAYEKTATREIASSGFRATGISPWNPNIFPDHVFLPSLTTDVPMPVPAAEGNESLNEDVDGMQETNNTETQTPTTSGPTDADLVNATEPFNQACAATSTNDDIENILEHLSPVPQSNVRKTAKRKTGGYQDVLTESPYLLSLREKEMEKILLQQRNKKRNVLKRKLVEDDSSEEERKKSQKQQRKSNRNVAQKKVVEYESSGEEDPFRVDDDELDCACLYCNDLFSRSKSREEWLQCQSCQKWSHSECAGLSKRAKNFVCELCSE